MQDVDTTATMRLIFSPNHSRASFCGDMFVFYTHVPYLYTFICMCISYRASRMMMMLMMMMRLLMMMPSDKLPQTSTAAGPASQNVQSQPFLLSLSPPPPLPLPSPSPLSLPLPPSSVQTRQAMPRLLVHRRSSRYTHDKTDTMPRGKKTLGGTSHYGSKYA